MISYYWFLFHLVLLCLVDSSPIKPKPGNPAKHLSGKTRYCNAWRLSVETGNAGAWPLVPLNCTSYVGSYMTGGQYLADADYVTAVAIDYARTVDVTGDGKDAWVFDIDETLLSNLPYFKNNGFGSIKFNATRGNEWVVQGRAPAVPPNLRLLKKLKRMGFFLVLLTGRGESQRDITVKNLLFAGYRKWGKLLLRQESDNGKTAQQYKSEQRAALIKQGFRIHGSCGDQWSDLLGFATAQRSFKVPNPMYYIE